MGSTGRFIPYRPANAELTETGYLKAWLSLVSDFDELEEPVLSTPTPVIGEKYTIGASHTWLEDKEALPIYVRKDTLEAPGESQGEMGSLRMLWTPKIFIIGDGAKILEMVNNWMNEDIIVFVQDQCTPAKMIQFGCDCQAANVQKNSFSSGTLKSGQKGYEMTLETYCKYFYNGSITERE